MEMGEHICGRGINLRTESIVLMLRVWGRWTWARLEWDGWVVCGAYHQLECYPCRNTTPLLSSWHICICLFVSCYRAYIMHLSMRPGRWIYYGLFAVQLPLLRSGWVLHDFDSHWLERETIGEGGQNGRRKMLRLTDRTWLVEYME